MVSTCTNILNCVCSLNFYSMQCKRNYDLFSNFDVYSVLYENNPRSAEAIDGGRWWLQKVGTIKVEREVKLQFNDNDDDPAKEVPEVVSGHLGFTVTALPDDAGEYNSVYHFDTAAELRNLATTKDNRRLLCCHSCLSE